MTVEFPVTNYVFRYLVHTYGEPPYHLAFNNQNDLRLALEFMTLRGEPVLKQTRHPGHIIRLEIGDDHRLARITRSHSPLLSAGLFFQYEFFRDMRRYVFAQEDLATRLGISLSEWNRQAAVQAFLDKYGITEEEYSLESAYRQFLRKKGHEDRFFSEKIRNKYSFSATGSDLYKLCTFTDRGRKNYMEPAVAFMAFSRSKERVVNLYHYIPRKHLYEGTHMDYFYSAAEVINTYLTSGHSVY